MIEKLDVMKDTRNVIDKDGIVHTAANFTAIEKINELVDAVNELQISANRMGFDKPKENKQDPYAEQRKWIGKLCRFWDEEYVPSFGIIGILTDVNDKESHPFQVNHRDRWGNCEPVKPDDDIIYKGE